MLNLIEITKNFGDVRALDSVSMEIKEGEVLGLVGPNGSGKSTLMKIILGIISPSSGKVMFHNEDLSEKGLLDFRKRLGYMPERVSFYDNLTGMETLRLFARVKGGSLDNIHGISGKMLSAGDLNRKVGGYSKGMRQRLNFAQALLNAPNILILDEPTSGLDPAGTKEFYGILDEVRSAKKLTVILSSHILAEIEDRIDRVAVMKSGNLKALGSLEELYTGLNLPMRISISVDKKDDALADLLKASGALDVAYKDGYWIASLPKEDKFRLLSALMDKKENINDFSIREPNLEEVFFGLH
jgi:Cu-processing system ATP-binding protein